MTTDAMPSALLYEQELLGIRNILWGDTIKDEIFARWSQGFYFSRIEPSALEQTQGGPCSILAPVQAYILKTLLQEYNSLEFRGQITEKDQDRLLASALLEILQLQSKNGRFLLAYLDAENSGETTLNGDTKGVPLPVSEHILYHNQVRLRPIDTPDDCQTFIREQIARYKTQFGILLFLYSVIASKGLRQVKLESDTNEPLIDETYGYGSQSLINLMITGRAVTYVWDYEQDVGGLKLKGLDKQSDIGFITLMEHMRYITVGSFYKSPKCPIWVLGSETHLTVLFSVNRALVSPETGSEQARRVFKNYDKDGNNFIKADDLQNVLADLSLVSETEYVNIMRRKLDSENLGIILLNAFMNEFYPQEESSTPDTFQLVHYNGLAQSNHDGLVKFRIGEAILLESDLRAMCESNPMLTCLQTKWPTIEINWSDNVTPSLN